MSMDYQIVPDKNDVITKWICKGLNYDENWITDHITFGFRLNEELIGGLIFHDYRPQQEIWWTVYSVDKRWCNRRMLRIMFGMAFEFFGCKRISLLVNKSNTASLNFVKKLGFQQEGMFRAYRDNGEDCCIFGMLKNECKWIKEKEKINE